MPATATLEELKTVDAALRKLKEEYPEAYDNFTRFFRDNRKIGYKNIIKMMIGEATPEKLKGMG
jgi:molybdopterin converting factor small subunit